MATGWDTNDDHDDHEYCTGCNDCCGDSDEPCEDCEDCDCDGRNHQMGRDVKHNQQPAPPKQGWSNKGEDMNKTVAKLYDQTVDAMLVNKFYGHQIQDTDVSYITLKDNVDDLLAAAKVKQEEEDERNKK